MTGNSHPAVQALLTAATAARQATVLARRLYTRLQNEIENQRLTLGKQLNGLILGTIWDAKPIAWRPRPLYQFDFGLPEPEVAAPQVEFDEDLVAQYHKAYLAEKDAWAEHDRKYQDLVTLWLRDEVELTPRESTGFMPETQVRIYEVRVK